jgi:hypothetical protein
MGSQKTCSGASSPDRKDEWLFETAESLSASSLINGVIKLVVGIILRLRDRDHDGLVETLHEAAGCYEALKSRDRSVPPT